MNESDNSTPPPPLVEASSFWVYLGTFATTFQTCLNILGTILTDEHLAAASNFTLPPVLLCYRGSFLSQPRRKSKWDMIKLRLHFVSFAYVSEVALFIWQLKVGDIGAHIFRAVTYTVVFHLGFKLQGAIARLPNNDLEYFLVNTFFKGGLRTLFWYLFLTFRTTTCLFEEFFVEVCRITNMCSTFISTYLLLWWGGSLISER